MLYKLLSKYNLGAFIGMKTGLIFISLLASSRVMRVFYFVMFYILCVIHIHPPDCSFSVANTKFPILHYTLL